MSSAVSQSVRILDLFFELLDSDRGRRLGRLCALRGYRDLTPETFHATFERDKDALRQCGVVLLVGEGEDPVYRVDPASFADDVPSLTVEQQTLIRLALGAWRTLNPTGLNLTEATINALTPATGSAQVAPLPLDLEGMDLLPVLLEAIATRRPVSFTHQSRQGRMERGVDPWRLVVRGRAIYLFGLDNDRGEPRTFRLSRIEGDVELLGEAGDAAPAPDDAPDPFEGFTVRPLVDAPGGIPTGLEGDLAATGEGSTRLGRGADRGDWHHLLVDHATDLTPVGPGDFVEDFRSRLASAASWGSGRGEGSSRA